MLLQTKLFIQPLRPNLVPRPHLIDGLNQGLQLGHKLTLVSAPAGFGKTTCIIEWLESLDLPVAWLTLDRTDDEPGRFFSYLIAALQQIDESLGRNIEGLLHVGQLPPSEVICATLINDIQAIDGRFLLVLDDFQVVQDQFILQVFQTLVSNMPHPLHLVLLTREEPSLPLVRMRANDQMTEVRAADLRFSQQETAVFLDEVMGISLPSADRAVLEEKTEGWIVGLQLAGFSMRNQADPSQFIASLSGSHRHILNYLTEEVLNQQPAEIQEFLLQTAILDKLTGDLCDAVTGGQNGRHLLEQIYNDNLFLIPLDDQQQWYRYHQLFADLLHDRLETLDPQEKVACHRRASRWYDQAGLPTEAIEHALAAADYETAVSLIEACVMDLLMAWHTKTIRGWMRALPPEWVARSPRTNLAFAWLYLPSGDFSQAQPYIERLQAMFAGEQLATFDTAIQAEWLALQATVLSAQGRLDQSLELANRALSLLPPEEVHVRSLTYSGLAGTYKQMNDYSRAANAYRGLIQHGRNSGSFVSEMMGISGLALYAMERGELHSAFELASQGLERIERSGVVSPISAAVYGEMGGIYYQWYQLDKAHPHFANATQISSLSGYSDAEIFHHIIHSRLALIEGDVERAVREMQAATDLNQIDAPAAIRDELISQEVRVLLAQDRLTAAEALLAPHGFTFQSEIAWPELRLDQLLNRWQALLNASALRIFLHQAQVRKQPAHLPRGLDLADRLIVVARANHFRPVVLETLLIRAQMRTAQGDPAAALADVAAALALAEQEGVIALFLEGGPAIASMLAQLLNGDQLLAIQPDYVQRILAAFPEGARSETHGEPDSPAANETLIEPLSRRELEILELIEAGYTNQQIAELLVVTLHTVKKHNSNIFAKLGVRSRTQAVAKGRELDLL